MFEKPFQDAIPSRMRLGLITRVGGRCKRWQPQRCCFPACSARAEVGGKRRPMSASSVDTLCRSLHSGRSRQWFFSTDHCHSRAVAGKDRRVDHVDRSREKRACRPLPVLAEPSRPHWYLPQLGDSRRSPAVQTTWTADRRATMPRFRSRQPGVLPTTMPTGRDG